MQQLVEGPKGACKAYSLPQNHTKTDYRERRLFKNNKNYQIMSNTDKNSNTVSSEVEQRNIVKFLTGSKKKRRIVKAIIRDQILFARTCNTLTHFHTVFAGKERGGGFEFEYAFSGIRTVCDLIGVTEETEETIIDRFGDFTSSDFFGKPTKRDPFEKEAAVFYKGLKSHLQSIISPDKVNNKPTEAPNF